MLSPERSVAARLHAYFDTLANLLRAIEVTDRKAHKVPLDEAVDWFRTEAHAAHDRINKIMFIGKQ